MEGVREGKLYFPLHKLANVREVLYGKACKLILSPIALKPFSFQKEREGEVGGYRGYTGRNPGEIGAREIQ